MGKLVPALRPRFACLGQMPGRLAVLTRRVEKVAPLQKGQVEGPGIPHLPAEVQALIRVMDGPCRIPPQQGVPGRGVMIEARLPRLGQRREDAMVPRYPFAVTKSPDLREQSTPWPISM